jgi:hypothetical protein
MEEDVAVLLAPMINDLGRAKVLLEGPERTFCHRRQSSVFMPVTPSSWTSELFN